jgi:hypothetical protein
MPFRSLIVLIAAGALSAMPVAAQDMPSRNAASDTAGTPAMAVKAKAHKQRKDGPHRMAMMDTDGDGKVSWPEFSMRLKLAFDRLDTNHDGYLDASEMPKGGKRGGLNDQSFGTWGKPSDSPPPQVPAPSAH